MLSVAFPNKRKCNTPGTSDSICAQAVIQLHGDAKSGDGRRRDVRGFCGSHFVSPQFRWPRTNSDFGSHSIHDSNMFGLRPRPLRCVFFGRVKPPFGNDQQRHGTKREENVPGRVDERVGVTDRGDLYESVSDVRQ